VRSGKWNDGEGPDSGGPWRVMEGQVIKVLISDDHPVLRRGLKEILMRELQGAVCGEAENGQQVLALVQTQNWDLVILDVTMPGRSGIEVLGDLKRMRPKLPVLVLSMHPEDQYAKRMLKAGASGYMNKEVAPDELIKAIRKILAGGRYVSSALAEKLALDLTEDAGRLAHETLSDREFEVLRMIASGKTVGKIAEELHLSVTTVSTYRARILEKLNMTTTAELMRYGFRNHLVD
jgi:two-component system invasion response regulator UvrY